MITGVPVGPAMNPFDDTKQALFQQQRQIYRTMVDQNYLFHREAYETLREVLIAQRAPFRFLDIGCGDASETIRALEGTRVSHFRGIDLSRAALEIARETLKSLDCPVALEQGDFAGVLRERPEPADIAWIGLSLHHFESPDKLAVMREIRGILGDRGLLLIYEDTSPDGEDREGWLRRWDEEKPAWSAHTPEEWDITFHHVSSADHPETVSGWRELGREARFNSVRELFVAPSNLLRLYCFGP